MHQFSFGKIFSLLMNSCALIRLTLHYKNGEKKKTFYRLINIKKHETEELGHFDLGL